MIAAGLQSTHSPRPSGAALPQSQSQTDHQDLGSRKSSSSDVIIACTRSETDMRRLKLCAFIMLEAPKTKKYNHNFANSHFLFWQKKTWLLKTISIWLLIHIISSFDYFMSNSIMSATQAENQTQMQNPAYMSQITHFCLQMSHANLTQKCVCVALNWMTTLSILFFMISLIFYRV